MSEKFSKIGNDIDLPAYNISFTAITELYTIGDTKNKDATAEEILENYKAGLSALAKELDRFSKELTLSDLKAGMSGEYPSLDVLVLDHYKPTRTVNQISLWSEVSPQTVTKVLKRNNIKAAPSKSSNRLNRDKLFALRGKSMSFKEISTLLDFPEYAIRDCFHETKKLAKKKREGFIR